MPSLVNCSKRFINNYTNLVNYISASLIICICLIVLLPKVHDSFLQSETQHQHNHAHDLPQPEIISNGSIAESIDAEMPIDEFSANLAPPSIPDDNNSLPSASNDANNNQHHHHNHTLPIGEIIICLGFFTFYCIGLSLSGKSDAKERDPLMDRSRGSSTICCSSTRCPSGKRKLSAGLSANVNMQSDFAKSKSNEELHMSSEQQDDNCVLLLNKHHNHHTHSHLQPPTVNLPNDRKKHYGSTSHFVEEIRISRVSNDFDEAQLSWPLATRVTLFGLLLAGALILFDMNIHGLMETVKVFRAVATGALLYIAFFLVLPKNPVGCNSCTEEEV